MKNKSFTTHTDLIIVGAGIIGLAHAVNALHCGLTVRIVERDSMAVGASVRNFGHICITAQTGEKFDMALRSREPWLSAAAEASFWASEAGSVAVARSAEEVQVLEEFADSRGSDLVQLLSANEVHKHLQYDHYTPSPGIIGGAFFPLDLRVDPRTTVGVLAAWLNQQDKASLEWSTTVHAIYNGTVETSKTTFTADHVLVCVGHDIDGLYPDIAQQWEITRCQLHMALADPIPGYDLESAVLTGTSLRRYDGPAEMPSAPLLDSRLQQEVPELLALGANIMFTRRPDGSILVGDSHAYGDTSTPFLRERTTDVLVNEVASVLGCKQLQLRERWMGVYASSSKTDVLSQRVEPDCTVVGVTSGLGMTVAFDLAQQTLDGL